jgi:hypothetical protein
VTFFRFFRFWGPYGHCEKMRDLARFCGEKTLMKTDKN